MVDQDHIERRSAGNFKRCAKLAGKYALIFLERFEQGFAINTNPCFWEIAADAIRRARIGHL